MPTPSKQRGKQRTKKKKTRRGDRKERSS